MVEEERAEWRGRFEGLSHALAFILAARIAPLSARERAQALEILRYPFKARTEQDLAAQPVAAQRRRAAVLETLEELANAAERLAGPPAQR